jgi:predicted kinase
MEPKRTPRLYLVCGLPGAGKTTRALRITESVRAVRLCPDEWLTSFGMSLVEDYEFRFKLEKCLLLHAEALLRVGVGVVIEFGSWSRAERELIRQTALRVRATAELHFLNAPIDELVRRVRARGGPEVEFLTSKVLLEYSHRFEPPDPAEMTSFDRYFGPDDDWQPELGLD